MACPGPEELQHLEEEDSGENPSQHTPHLLLWLDKVWSVANGGTGASSVTLADGREKFMDGSVTCGPCQTV